jgi:ABC-type transporter MlaC component
MVFLSGSAYGSYSQPTVDEAKVFLISLIEEAKKDAEGNDSGMKLAKHFRDSFDLKAMAGDVLKDIVRDQIAKHANDRAKTAAAIKPFSDKFLDVFARHVLTIYSTPEKIKLFKGTSYRFKSAEPAGDGRSVTVTFMFSLAEQNKADVPVKFYVTQQGGRILVQDLYLDAFNLLQNEREVVTSIYRQHGENLDSVLAIYGK